MKRKMVIDGNAVYEIDEDCMLEKGRIMEEQKEKESCGEESPEVPKGTFRDCKRSSRSLASSDFGSSPLQKKTV